MPIIGAGLAGMICSYVFPQEPILEAGIRDSMYSGNHKAVLRFRSDTIGKLTGIPFREVTVRKGIFYHGEFREPSILMSNLYSYKCLGRLLGDRSIWNLESVTRYIAPEDFYKQLLDAAQDRIRWGIPANFRAAKRTGIPLISTAPMPAVLDELQVIAVDEFVRSPINVLRFRINGADVFQTVYFPTIAHTLYRASITGDLLICEFSGEPEGPWKTDVQAAFSILPDVPIDSTTQRYGKIAPIDNERRKALIHELSREHNVFSVGRFATWRNILLDDVVKDAYIVKQLINASKYDMSLRAV